MKKTEYRVIARWPHTGEEHVAFKSSNGDVEALKEEFDQVSNDRYLGEFVGVEKREKSVSEWEKVEPEPPYVNGFRRRCGWCCVTLRWWQLNLCRVCRIYVSRDHPSPPCPPNSRLDKRPDDIRSNKRSN